MKKDGFIKGAPPVRGQEAFDHRKMSDFDETLDLAFNPNENMGPGLDVSKNIHMKQKGHGMVGNTGLRASSSTAGGNVTGITGIGMQI